MEIKKKNLKLMLVATFGLLLISTGITWAFFNYTRTGEANVFETGDIYFNSDYTSVTLTNIFPINKGKIETDTENVMTVNVSITGNTTYKKGVDFKIMAKDVSLQTNGKSVPISVRVTSENIPNVETFNFENEMVVVENSVFAQGSILPADGEVDGVVTIKAFIDKNNVVISDTYDGTESDEMGTTNEFVNGRIVFTTDEWNNLESNGGVSFKVKVIAWEHEETLHDVMLANAVMDNIASDYVTSPTGINFGVKSSDENGKGLYMRAGTENDAYPIVYYRGDVQDNNVIFGDFCWKAVRTTETGGVKLIYNGVPGDAYERIVLAEDKYSVMTNTLGFTFDATDNSWNAEVLDQNGEFSFKVPSGVNYIMKITGTTPSTGSGSFQLAKNNVGFNGGGNGGGRDMVYEISCGDLVDTDIIKITALGSSNGTTFKIKMIGNGEYLGTGCDNSGIYTQLETKSAFNANAKSLAYNGYMYNKVYNSYSAADVSTAYFGSGFTYENGVYKLIDPILGTDINHHYTLTSGISDDVYSKIYYVYRRANNYTFIELSDGKSVEDAINEMLYENDVNKIDSSIKNNIETWFENNLLDVVDQLEDTVWCNDRNILKNGNYAFSNSGWNPNGGSLSKSVYFEGYNRVYELKTPSLVCSNKNDRFSVGNRGASIKYPVGLITSDEVMYAGASSSEDVDYYLKSNEYYWTMTSSDYGSYAIGFAVTSGGYLSSSYVLSNANGVRPSISLAYGATIESGEGTVSNPYVIGEY